MAGWISEGIFIIKKQRICLLTLMFPLSMGSLPILWITGIWLIRDFQFLWTVILLKRKISAGICRLIIRSIWIKYRRMMPGIIILMIIWTGQPLSAGSRSVHFIRINSWAWTLKTGLRCLTTGKIAGICYKGKLWMRWSLWFLLTAEPGIRNFPAIWTIRLLTKIGVFLWIFHIAWDRKYVCLKCTVRL